MATRLRQIFRRPGAEIWVALAACVFIWAGIAVHLSEERAQALTAVRNDASRLARGFEESLRRSVREIDQTLLYVRALHDRDGDALDLTPWVNAGEVQRSLALQVSLVDGNGIVTMTNLLRPHDRIDLSDRPHFRYFVEHPTDELFISVPVIGRVSRTATIQFVRRLQRIGPGPADPGRAAFGGIVVVSVQPSTLVRFHQTMEMEASASVSVTGLDGIVRARAGDGGAALGAATTSPAPARLAGAADAVFEWQDPADGVVRIVGARRVADLPLFVEVALPREAAVAKFQGPVDGNLIAGVVLTVAVVLSAAVTRRHRRRLRVTQATLAAAVENITQGLLVVGPDGRILAVNRRWRELTDVPAPFGPGSEFRDIVRWQFNHGEYGADMVEADVQRMLRTGSMGREVPPRYLKHRPNGKTIEIVSCFLADGTLVRTFDDVTEREATEEVLRRARDAAEAAARARTQFLTVMSHEIRTPLNGILGVSDLLRDSNLSARQGDLVGLISESGGHLLALVNDILDFSRIEHAGIELEEIVYDPRAIMQSLESMFAAPARERGLALSIDVDASVPAGLAGDSHRLLQVLINLVGNALKFTEAGGVWVELRAVPLEEAGSWRLEGSVSDSGIGMSEESLGRLFQEFTQVDGSITRRFGGSGLGLAISRRLVEAMGGGISVQSTPGMGSVFRFDVRARIAELAPPSAVAAPVALSGVRVLLAEDQKVNAIVARGLLERLGCTVTIVGNGREAVECLAAAAGPPCGFDVMLMDVMMPEMDGLAATRAIRALPGAAGAVPVIGLTANAFASDRAACLDAGMTGFVPKPVTLRLLAEALATAVDGRGEVVPEDVEADLSVLESLAGTLGGATVAGLIASYRADLPGQLRRMAEQASAGDAMRLTREAHAVAGSAATIGLTDLAAEARSLERALRGGESVDMPACVAAIQRLAEAAMHALGAAEQRLAA